MKTTFRAQPGFTAATTNKVDPTIPIGFIRLDVITMEQILIGDDVDMDTKFTILAALSENDKCKKILCNLYNHLHANREHFL